MLHRSILYLSMALIGIICSVPVDVPNKCPQPTTANPSPPTYYYVHPDNCSFYFRCVDGVPSQMYCAPGTRFSELYMTCVAEFSRYDTCSRDNAVRECSRGATLIGHPLICQRYFNCSDFSLRFFRDLTKDFEDECSYPQLFDIIDRKCKSFKEAYCGPYRTPGVIPCSYAKSSIRMCNDYRPSCAGFSDGFNEHPLRLWSPYYIQCDSQRTVNTILFCPSSSVGGAGIFSPVKKTCVSLWEVPRNNGGLQPTCEGKAAGQYGIDENPRVYYICPGPIVAYCPVGTAFNNITLVCG